MIPVFKINKRDLLDYEYIAALNTLQPETHRAFSWLAGTFLCNCGTNDSIKEIMLRNITEIYSV